MVSKKSRSEVRAKKHYRLRNHISGTAERPRLAVFRSNNHMYAQIIDDTVGNTLVSASTLQKDVKAELEKTNNLEKLSQRKPLKKESKRLYLTVEDSFIRVRSQLWLRQLAKQDWNSRKGRKDT